MTVLTIILAAILLFYIMPTLYRLFTILLCFISLFMKIIIYYFYRIIIIIFLIILFNSISKLLLYDLPLHNTICNCICIIDECIINEQHYLMP